ncbi:MAG: Hsp20/alpha crystallin family protein [Deltaproteobacteria bacterium]|nr:Hsp20/alpha crystallin family protein [Deltaproteobacteria bacterium]
MERSYGYFNRTIELPAEVDPEKVDASYKKGVLKIELKKTRESQSKKIEIKS